MHIVARHITHSFLAFALLALAACAHREPGSDSAAPTPWSNARQMVLVTTDGWDANQGAMRTYERRGDEWVARGDPVPVTVGRSGTAWGIGLHPAQTDGPTKREGDGRAPAGVFEIGEAFGYAASATTALPYAQMRDSSWCMDVVGSPLYNRIVDADDVGSAAVEGSSEPMRRDIHANGDQRYRNGFVIQHNRDNRSGAGSCIFAHLWKAPGEPTAGCTAMAPTSMQRLYGWLRPEAHPVFVLLPLAEYDRLKADWRLPVNL